jgi:hypothetical protein
MPRSSGRKNRRGICKAIVDVLRNSERGMRRLQVLAELPSYGIPVGRALRRDIVFRLSYLHEKGRFDRVSKRVDIAREQSNESEKPMTGE